jgi:glucosamine-6-phosphate deaminase
LHFLLPDKKCSKTWLSIRIHLKKTRKNSYSSRSESLIHEGFLVAMQAGIRFVQGKNSEAVGLYAARLIADCVQKKPASNLVFPTGNTPKPLYKILRNPEQPATPNIDWTQTHLFHLDEYVPPAKESENSENTARAYETFGDSMRRELWDFVDGQTFFFEDYVDNPTAYETLIQQHGGLDMAIVGIGRNGHIAFNEPPSGPDSPTRRLRLSEATLKANFGITAPGEHPATLPREAVTLGMAAIFSARQIVLLATGENKHAIIRQAFDPELPPSVDCPASWLKRHGNVVVLTDFALDWLEA